MISYRAAIIAGIIMSSLIAFGMTLWNWIENPGSIFHDSSGTNWTFVWDTFLSWFGPLLLLLVPALLLTAYLKYRES